MYRERGTPAVPQDYVQRAWYCGSAQWRAVFKIHVFKILFKIHWSFCICILNTFLMEYFREYFKHMHLKYFEYFIKIFPSIFGRNVVFHPQLKQHVDKCIHFIHDYSFHSWHIIFIPLCIHEFVGLPIMTSQCAQCRVSWCHVELIVILVSRNRYMTYVVGM